MVLGSSHCCLPHHCNVKGQALCVGSVYFPHQLSSPPAGRLVGSIQRMGKKGANGKWGYQGELVGQASWIMGAVVLKWALHHTCEWRLMAIGLQFPQATALWEEELHRFPRAEWERSQPVYPEECRPVVRVCALSLSRPEPSGEELRGPFVVPTHLYQE